MAIIYLGRRSPVGSCTLPATSEHAEACSRGGPPLVAYLGLLAVGFTLPRSSPTARCALTAPFHPYRAEARRYLFCGTFPRLAPGWCYQPPCPAQFGLSSRSSISAERSPRPLRSTPPASPVLGHSDTSNVGYSMVSGLLEKEPPVDAVSRGATATERTTEAAKSKRPGLIARLVPASHQPARACLRD